MCLFLFFASSLGGGERKGAVQHSVSNTDDQLLFIIHTGTAFISHNNCIITRIHSFVGQQNLYTSGKWLLSHTQMIYILAP